MKSLTKYFAYFNKKACSSANTELHYFYMDTKTDINGGPSRGKESFALVEELKPDGIITADDNA